MFKYVLNNGLFNEEVFVEKIYGVPILLIEDESDNYSSFWSNNSEWSNTYEEYFSPETSITDSPYTNYNNNAEEIINLINEIDLSGYSYAEINFDAKWNIESGYDYVQVEISDDAGNNWIPQCGKYTNIGIETHDYAINEPLYHGNQNEWVNESILLTDYIDQQISIRFKLYSDGGLRRDGFYFDNFKIKGLSSNLNISDDTLNITKISPVPSENMVFISSDEVINKVEIYDILGKSILSIDKNNIKSFSVRSLNNGIYIVKLSSLNSVETHRIIKK